MCKENKYKYRARTLELDKEGFKDTVKCELGFEGVKEFKSQHGAGEGRPAYRRCVQAGAGNELVCCVSGHQSDS